MLSDVQWIVESVLTGLKEAASLAGKSSSDVIIIHAGTNNVDNSSPEQLCEDAVNVKQSTSEQPKS